MHPLSRLPAPWRKILDWVVTLALAIGFVLAFEAEVAKPFRIPSASMEPYLQCGRPAAGCTGSTSDRVLVNRLAYRFGSPKRGQIVVFQGAGSLRPVWGWRRRQHLREAADRIAGRSCLGA